MRLLILLGVAVAAAGCQRPPAERPTPFFILVTTDWDYADPGPRALEYQDRLHAGHPSLRLTHFAAPYTFTDAAVPPARQEAIAAWLRAQRDTFHDEIALHIHPYCSFVTAAGARCITDRSTIAAGDPTGYSVPLTAYRRDALDLLLAHATTLFEQHGLGRPTSFRAGDWAANDATIGALLAHGFRVDSSAINWHRIEELANTDLYRSAQDQWAAIGDTTQPYWPTEGLLEVPDNGAMIDYVSLDEMKELFDRNAATPVTGRHVLTVGFHPAADFSDADYARIDGFLSHVDDHLAARGLGQAVYVTMQDLAVSAFR